MDVSLSPLVYVYLPYSPCDLFRYERLCRDGTHPGGSGSDGVDAGVRPQPGTWGIQHHHQALVQYRCVCHYLGMVCLKVCDMGRWSVTARTLTLVGRPTPTCTYRQYDRCPQHIQRDASDKERPRHHHLQHLGTWVFRTRRGCQGQGYHRCVVCDNMNCGL